MLLVIDSCIYCSDFNNKNASFELLFNYLEKDLTSKLLIPQVVCSEVTNKYKEKNDILIGEIEKATSKARHYSRARDLSIYVDNIKDCVLENTVEYLNYFFDNLCNRIGVEVIDYPIIAHKDIIERALLRRKPFDDRGEDGYRDTLIWETLLETSARYPDSDIYFISSNINDFAKKAEDGSVVLHPSLVDELICSRIYNIFYYSSLKDFVKNEIAAKYRRLENPKTFSAEFSAICTSASSLRIIEDAFKDMDYNSFIGFPEEYETITLRCLEDIEEIVVNDVSIIEDDLWVVETSVKVVCIFEFYIFKADFYADEYPDYEIEDADWNEHYVFAYETSCVNADIAFVFNDKTQEISSCEIVDYFLC
ncbi:MAG: PIN domain-containing protein [Oscillospiraceae bacterium]|jgi:hypothetical protein|nr:PIN domain-containing protein [Oscillospiraceae bacterium]